MFNSSTWAVVESCGKRETTRTAPQTAPQIPPPKSKKAGGDRRGGGFGWSEDDEFIPWAFDSCPLYGIYFHDTLMILSKYFDDTFMILS